MISKENHLLFCEVDISELSEALQSKPVIVTTGGKEKPLLLDIPGTYRGHISFNAPIRDSDYSVHEGTFLRKYGVDEHGRAKNKDYIITNAVTIFQLDAVYLMLDPEENPTEPSDTLLRLSPSGVLVFSDTKHSSTLPCSTSDI